jgi:hypothetical protein
MDLLTKRQAQSSEELQVRKMNFERVVDEGISTGAWTSLRDIPLIEVEVFTGRGIEDSQEPSLHVVFANEFIGGGVLQYGNVQTELMLLQSILNAALQWPSLKG